MSVHRDAHPYAPAGPGGGIGDEPRIAWPHSLEAEGEIISAMFVAPLKVCPVVRERIKPEHFYKDRHRLLYEHSLAVWKDRGALDPVLIQQRLKDKGAFERCGGARGIGEAMDHEGISANIEHYCDVLIDKARQRQVIEAGEQLRVIGNSDYLTGNESLVAASRVLQRLDAIVVDQADAFEANAPLVGSFLEDAAGSMHARAHGDAQPIPLPDELGSVSEALDGGLWGGHQYVLVGSTGAGKTQFALQVGLTAARGGVPVLYIGLELGQDQLIARLAALVTGPFQWSELYYGRRPSGVLLRDESDAVMTTAADVLRELPLRLEVGGPHGWDYGTMYRRVAAMKKRHGVQPQDPVLVVLDFLQIVASPEGAREDLRERIGRAAYAGRAVARDLNAAVVLVSAMSRESTKMVADWSGLEERKRAAQLYTLMGVGKESGEIEYSTDGLLVLVRKPKTAQRSGGTAQGSEGGATVYLAIPKRRAGVEGIVEMRFDGSRFKANGR